MAKGKFIAYYRVSTRRQGASGLGLEAQQSAVRDYLNGGRWQLVEEIVEVESGKREDRPQLARALDLCRAWRATLIIAKLDRLARNVEFTARLMNSGVEFVAVDSPGEPAHDPHPCCYGGARTRDDQRPDKGCIGSSQDKRCQIGRQPSEPGPESQDGRER